MCIGRGDSTLLANVVLMFLSLSYALFTGRVFLLLIRILTNHFIWAFISGTL